MNERIKQLAEQSTDKWVGGEFFDKEKFAKLIVRECIQLSVNEEERFNNMGEGELALAMENFQGLLKQHFGVEE